MFAKLHSIIGTIASKFNHLLGFQKEIHLRNVSTFIFHATCNFPLKHYVSAPEDANKSIASCRMKSCNDDDDDGDENSHDDDGGGGDDHDDGGGWVTP